jgi:hypothetical protein
MLLQTLCTTRTVALPRVCTSQRTHNPVTTDAMATSMYETYTPQRTYNHETMVVMAITA